MTQIISKSAKIGKDTKLGYNVIIEDGVQIGDGCLIGHNVIIREDSIIGNEVRIDDNTIIGKLPMKAPRSIFQQEEKLPCCKIADNCLIGANIVVYRGSTIGKKTLIADLSTIRENVEIGDYTIIGRGVTVENYVKIGSRCKLETNVYITAYSELGDYCFIAPCVATSNDNYMGRDKERFKHFKGVTVRTGARIGVNATILPGITIAEDGVVAAGSVVTRDVPKEKIVLGSPAKIFRNVPEPQLLKNNRDK
ncbi:MAG: N-acetyltransferase [Candidatus Cloacimonadota bacterium]|nr:MAG: N-acetyltransferase [Candidatus Cloacimonadota bacterium]